MRELLDEEVDCPICLDPMHSADQQHPLQCTTKQCDFNFCHTCIESLITSSKDDYGEASDGNKHVKVFLHCPNCRSDLGPTIRETLLLRKADFLVASTDLSDEELTASQLRMRNVMDEPEVQRAIAVAREREIEFFDEKYADHGGAEPFIQRQETIEEDDESDEWGIEVDIRVGVHKSFRFPKSAKQAKKDPFKIDKTLFAGLDFSMTEAEQQYLTELMTSGDTCKLANAAAILHGILNMERRSIPSTTRHLQKRSSIFQLIEEAEKAHCTTRKVAPVRVPSATPAQIQAAMKRRQAYMKAHPLPLRMPKHVELTVPESENKFGLRFCDDTWNGTVMDAYSKITISRGNKVYKKKSENRGVKNVLSEGHPDADFGDARIDVERDRVLVSSVRGEGGKMGILRGDVVTHLNGEEFTGNAADLMAAILAIAKREQRDETFTLVLNAERSTAEALRRRALIRR